VSASFFTNVTLPYEISHILGRHAGRSDKTIRLEESDHARIDDIGGSPGYGMRLRRKNPAGFELLQRQRSTQVMVHTIANSAFDCVPKWLAAKSGLLRDHRRPQA